MQEHRGERGSPCGGPSGPVRSREKYGRRGFSVELRKRLSSLGKRLFAWADPSHREGRRRAQYSDFRGAAGLSQQGGGVSACFRGGQGDYRQLCGRASLALPPGPLFCPPGRQAAASAEGGEARADAPPSGDALCRRGGTGRGLRAKGKRKNGRKKERGARPAPLSRANRSIFPACPCRPCTSAAAGGWPRCRLPGGCFPGRR